MMSNLKYYQIPTYQWGTKQVRLPDHQPYMQFILTAAMLVTDFMIGSDNLAAYSRDDCSYLQNGMWSLFDAHLAMMIHLYSMLTPGGVRLNAGTTIRFSSFF
jgi:hypothetical protein